MFANPWYLQQQAAKQALMEQMEAAEGEGAERAGDTREVDSQNNQLGSSLDTSTSSSHSSSSGRGSGGGATAVSPPEELHRRRARLQWPQMT